ncbi:nose resistant to fluoxetine protein 6 isoform X1 [Plutella xylostella]|uniref:nose resistant to fluoxetine protein 6 isoform X1 n=1 Tax=Plutella xylostella TaxID=51655 RepID=UPI0020323026|nr:nose resistant to fluoxetine protein 6 isoform X1 [Plutella xylostella]
MGPLLVLCLCLSASVVYGEEVPGAGGSAREEKLRSALIDAFQNIKKTSARGLDDEGLGNSDLIGSQPAPSAAPEPHESFDLFADDDGLSFAEAFSETADDAHDHSTEKSHNVQHIVKAPAKNKTTSKPGRDSIIQRFSNSIRTTINETRNISAKRESASYNESAFLGIDNTLRVFDSEILVRQWRQLRREVAGRCLEHLQLYVDGLVEKRLWAMKMDDASGRYSSMFYWGNNYWTGSSELCLAINDAHEPDMQQANKSSGSQIFAAWRDDVSLSGARAPFEAAFYSARLALTLAPKAQITNFRRTVHVGLCLPRSCTPADVGRVLAAARAPLLRHAVLAVRAPAQGTYQYLEDPTFRVLLSICCIVGTLLVAATAYDMKLARDVRRRRRRVENMAAVESGRSLVAATDAKAIVSGKSLYNENNNIALNSNHSEERLTAETVSNDGELKLSVWSELLLSFSMKANILQIFDQSVGADTIPVVHGLRCMSMVWVIFGHTCIVVFKYADNTALRAMLEQSFWFQLIISAVYSVDTFFCLGGMLVTFLYFRTNAKGKLDLLTKGRRKFTAGLLQFLGLIAYRFARLTAPYLFMLGVVEVTMKWFQHNAVFEPPALDHETCPQYWWRNLLYINTLFPVEQMCMLWSWYLSDDTQFYAVSAVLLILATSNFNLSAALTGVFFISSLLTTGYVSWSNEHVPNGDDPFTSFDKIYDKPWTRLGPYLVGMATGWILFKTNLRIRMNKLWVTVGWLCCTGTLLFLIFGLYNTRLSVAAAAAYSALSHSLWAAAIGWIIVACSTGYGGWVRSLLAAPVLYPFSRVTYCAYLVHPVVLRYVAMHLTHPIHLGELLVFVLFLGLTVISYVLAFIISVAFEAPMVTMLKILSPQRKPHRV